MPRCLVRLWDPAHAYPELDGEGMELWLDNELEALRWDADPDVSTLRVAFGDFSGPGFCSPGLG